jgi:ribosomal protein S27AE
MPSREALKTPVNTSSGEIVPQANNLCIKCGAQEFRCRHSPLFLRMFSLAPFTCGRCDHRETRFQFSFATLFALLGLAVIAAGTVWLIQNKPWIKTDEAQVNTAEALSKARNAAGALSTFEMMMLKKPRGTMDNAAVLQMWKANVGVSVIMQMIRTSNADYDVSPKSVIELKQAGVDQTIILAMIDATYNVR